MIKLELACNANKSLLTKKSINFLNKLDIKTSLKSPEIKLQEFSIPNNTNKIDNKTLFLSAGHSVIKDNIQNKISYIDNIYEYLKTLSILLPIYKNRGLSIKLKQNNSYLFRKIGITNPNNINNINVSTLESTNKLLKYFFKSLYCIISKPVYLIRGDKITIKLFYYLNIPNKKIYKWFNIFNNKRIKNYYINLSKNKIKLNLLYQKYLKKNFSIKNRIFKYKFKKAYINLRKKYFNMLSVNNLHNKYTIIKLFKNSLNKVYYKKFKIICDILSNKFNKPVELELTRLHQPFQNSNILVNLIAMNLRFKKKSSILIKKIYNRKSIKKLNVLPKIAMKNNILYNIRPNAFVSGLNIKIAGRLMREPIIPRLTIKKLERGAIATGKVNFLDISSITNKNKKGAFTIKIVSGQNFYN